MASAQRRLQYTQAQRSNQAAPLGQRDEFHRAGLNGMRAVLVDDNPVERRILAVIVTIWLMKPTLADGAPVSPAHLEQPRAAGTPFSLALIDAISLRESQLGG
jgi:hypothetical protein